MVELGLLPSIAQLARTDSEVIGFVIHLVVAALLGASFGALVAHQRPEPGETVFWGLAYGAIWWFVGAVTLLPLFSGQGVSWTAEGAAELFPALMGHLLWGIITALVYVGATAQVERRSNATPWPARFVRGAIAGLAGGILAVIIRPVEEAGRAAASTSGLTLLVLGVLSGTLFAALFPLTSRGSGPAAIRGMSVGFMVWVVAALTVVPALDESTLLWNVDSVRDEFVKLPAFLLFLGAAPALFYQWITNVIRTLFADPDAIRSQEGVGASGLRSITQGAVAGLVGGLVFTIVMVRIGFFSTVAEIVGGDAPVLGFLVHLAIANVIGVGYGVLFVRRANDNASALGWGVSYGVLWWFLGPLTLLPILLGGSPLWTIEATMDAFPALIGHIAYGAFLGLTFFRLERRYNPWWLTRNAAEAGRADREARQLQSSAPALWMLTVLIAVVLPILVA